MPKTDAFYLLQAIRNGTVPQFGTHLIATGIDHHLEELCGLLDSVDQKHSLFKWIIGEYGSGKTFLTMAFQEKCLQKRAIVSNITISQETPMHKFEDFYKSVIQHLTLPESPLVSGLPILLETWLLQLENQVKESVSSQDKHISKESKQLLKNLVGESLTQLGQTDSGFTRALQAYYEARWSKDNTALNAVIGWLKGERIPYTIKDRIGLIGEVNRQTAYSHLQVLLYLIRSVGYHSLVIIIDEVESLLRLRTQNLRQSAYDNIRYLLDECSKDHFPNCFFLFTGTPALLDDERGFPGFPALLDRLYSFRETHYENYRLPLLYIDPWNEEKAFAVSKKIYQLHRETYAWNQPLSEEILQQFIQQYVTHIQDKNLVPRHFLKCLVDNLDKKQQYPAYDILSFTEEPSYD